MPFTEPYFLFTLSTPNSGTLPSSLGVLDGNGQASAGVNVQAGTAPGIVSVSLNHAYAVFNSTPNFVFVSNAAPLNFLP